MKQLTNTIRGKEQVLNISAVIILILTISSLSFAQGFQFMANTSMLDSEV